MKELKVERLKVETTFDGTRVNPEKSGSITQICSENLTPEDFCYGVLKGMSTELYQMYDYSERNRYKDQAYDWFREWTEKKSVLCEIIEDMFKAELVLAECEGSCDRGGNEQ